ncbi:Os06g0487380, partial [Oryza sativa Japonica Group]
LSLFPRDPRFLLPLSLLSRSDAALLFSFHHDGVAEWSSSPSGDDGGAVGQSSCRVERQPERRQRRGSRAEQRRGLVLAGATAAKSAAQ